MNKSRKTLITIPVISFILWPALAVPKDPVILRGSILDRNSGESLAARVYLQSSDGTYHFVDSTAGRNSSVVYNKQRSPTSLEMHTSVAAQPFFAALAPGSYTITVERGKEYLPYIRTVELHDDVELEIPLTRWIDVASLGWYSGETHVHRSLDELPTAMLAEDLNVALPLTYWVTRSDTPPSRGDKNSEPASPQLIQVDSTHVIYPLNTEYEITRVNGRSHVLGAVFALNHKDVLSWGAPPVAPIAEQVHREGGLLELDKHNWPWSMMLVPVMNVDLYELTNNHIWRTDFYFGRFGVAPPPYMNIDHDDQGMTEEGWIDFTFQNYYALLNCGFRLRPTAGTASGVHPVPLGYGRVFVHLDGRFSYDAWMSGLNEGRSFVTTGPLMDIRIDGRRAGHTFRQDAGDRVFRIAGLARSQNRLTRIEVVSGGDVAAYVTPTNAALTRGGYESRIDVSILTSRSTWLIVRCFEATPAGRLRFAHTAPWHVEMVGRPLHARREEVRYLIERMEEEIQRNKGVLPAVALDEYQAALATYQRIERSLPSSGGAAQPPRCALEYNKPRDN